MECGPQEQWVRKQCQIQGIPLPERIANAPELTTGLEFYLEGFYSLHSTRSSGFSMGPIPWTSMQKYCEVYSIQGAQRERFFFYLSEMDAAFLKWRSEQNEQRK